MPFRAFLKRHARPPVYGAGVVCVLWVVLCLTVRHFWLGLPENRFTSKLINIYVYMVCLLFICCVVSLHAYWIFHKNDFNYWFSTMGFLLYVLAQIVVLVNALNMPKKFKVEFCVECLIVFVCLCLYTQAVTMQQRVLRDLQSQRAHEVKESRIRDTQAGCFTVPLSVDKQAPGAVKVQFKGSSVHSAGLKGKSKATV